MNYYNVPGRKRATWHNEPEVDPFDVFTCKTVAINDYQKIELEPCRVRMFCFLRAQGDLEGGD